MRGARGTRRLAVPSGFYFQPSRLNRFSCFTKLARPPTPRSMVLVLPFCMTVAEQPFEQDSTSVAFPRNRGRQGTGTFPRLMPGVGLDGTQKRAYESFADQASAIHSVIRRMSPSAGQKGQCRDPGRRSTGPMRLDPTHGCPRPQDLSSLLLQ